MKYASVITYQDRSTLLMYINHYILRSGAEYFGRFYNIDRCVYPLPKNLCHEKQYSIAQRSFLQRIHE